MTNFLRNGAHMKSYLSSDGVIRGGFKMINSCNLYMCATLTGVLDVYFKRSSLYKVFVVGCVKDVGCVESRTVGCVFTGSRRCVYKSKCLSRFA